MQKDIGLIGNEKIEEYIGVLKEHPEDEVLAAVLTAIRKRMQEGGQFVVAVQMAVEGGLKLETKVVGDRGDFFMAFTSFEEQMIGGKGVMSTFMADISQLFDMVLADDSVSGVLLNPYNLSILLDREVIHLITGKNRLT